MSPPKAVVFDCDGVILQSNTLKSNAFGDVLKIYDPDDVTAFVAWHKATGGVSRFYKFAHFFRDVQKDQHWESLTKDACLAFGDVVSAGLKVCETVPGFDALVEQLARAGVPMGINTGGAEKEVREVFALRGMDKEFDVIFGSPTTKYQNMEKLRDLGLATPGCAYIGDSKLDFDLACNFGLAFYFVVHESEWAQGVEVTLNANMTTVQDLTELLQGGTKPIL
jgi:phosphoglycolate phosphatase-like HAD superfamily hydrolase